MKNLLKFVFFLAFVAGIAALVKKLVFDQEAASEGAGAGVLPETPVTPLEDAPLGGEISPALREILVDPEDKGSLDLVDDGKFLLNPRNGYKYPIRNGIPVMLLEEGKKYQDTSLVSSNGQQKAEEQTEEKAEKAG